MTLFVSRPASTAFAEVSAWNVDFPDPAPTALPGDALLWSASPPVLIGHGVVDAPVTQDFVLPNTGAPTTFSVQLVVLHASLIPGGAQAPAACGSGTSELSASPALWIRY
jgi:hypothetical protein